MSWFLWSHKVIIIILKFPNHVNELLKFKVKQISVDLCVNKMLNFATNIILYKLISEN